MWKPIYNGYYEINRSGVIRRKEPAQGTRVGRKLKPFNGDQVTLSCQGCLFYENVKSLVRRAFR